MKRNRFLAVLLAEMLAGTLPLRAGEDDEQPKHHHDLRGKIVSVDTEKNKFALETHRGRTVVCFIDARTVVKRAGRRIELNEVRVGERARCHCAALRDGRHYSQQLLLEKNK